MTDLTREQIEAVKEVKWSDVFWKYVKMGHDRSSAAFEADKRAKRQCTSTHCERRQECASPADCHGDFGMDGFKITKDWLEKQVCMAEIIEWQEPVQISQNVYLALCRLALQAPQFQPAQPSDVVEKVQPKFTYGHCEHKKQVGGCQLNNVQCNYPDCDRKPTITPA